MLAAESEEDRQEAQEHNLGTVNPRPQALPGQKERVYGNCGS